MTRVSSHPPGNFCWFELGTTDWQAGRKFDAGLFGWKWNEMPMQGGDDTAAKAKKLGATVMAESFDVFDFGRMAVMMDPRCAAFSLLKLANA